MEGVTDFHCAWGGRLCLHPFNLGFRIALSRDSEIPNLKECSLSRCDSNRGLYSKSRFVFGRKAAEPNRDLSGSGSMPPPHA